MKASLITIGDEILIGQIVDTNSSYISAALNRIGIAVVRHCSVADNRSEIYRAVDREFSSADIVIITGGLGPTKDDITKSVLCDYFHTTLTFNDDVYRNVCTLLGKKGIAINENNRSQAYVPASAIILPNGVGTAAGMAFVEGDKLLFSLPGVPHEMRYLIDTHVLTEIRKRCHLQDIVHRTIITHGIPESILAERIATWENALPAWLHLAYLPAPGMVKLRLSAYDVDTAQKAEIDRYIGQLTDIVPPANIFAMDDLSFEEIVGQLLRGSGMTIATAESCTGGKIASLITSVPGSSEYFKGSVVSYANEVKANVLGVSASDLSQYGAVSHQVVTQMATGVRQLLHTDFAVATSGVAGPAGGSPNKPVGTVFVAVADKNNSKWAEFHFADNREINIFRACNAAFTMLIEAIREKLSNA